MRPTKLATHRAGFMKQMRAVISPHNEGMNLGRVMLKLTGGRAPQRILCVGHSLGGAVRLLACWLAGH